MTMQAEPQCNHGDGDDKIWPIQCTRTDVQHRFTRKLIFLPAFKNPIIHELEWAVAGNHAQW